jgi:hypothetical protein
VLLALLALAAGCGRVDAPDPSDADTADAGDAAIEPCEIDGECDDLIACTVDHCAAGACVHVPCVDCCPEGRVCLPGFGCGQAPVPCDTDEECQDDTPCTLDRCRDGEQCEHLPQNTLCDDGEICLAALGCIPPPPAECDVDDDCTAGRPCLGAWYCDPEFGCQFLEPTFCDDGDACTDDRCVDAAGGCVHEPRDQDDDGHGDAACGGDDCDDTDPSVGAPADESCNGLDDDCDGAVDEGFDCAPAGRTEDCTTTCGSTGERQCLPGCEWDRCAPPDETCNGDDDDCDGAVDEGCCAAGLACVTDCGSLGTTACPPGGEVRCEPPPEVCNGLDDDCVDGADQGFECAPPGRSDECETECGSAGVRECLPGCAWDRCVPPVEICNGVDDDCNDGADEGFACRVGEVRACRTACGSDGADRCLPGCIWEGCVPPHEACNGVDDDCDLACDDGFACCAGATVDCALVGDWYTGTATCRGDCSGWDESACTTCGDGAIDAGEECDGADLGDERCATLGDGFDGGVLRCAAGCAFDTTGCTACGNGVLELGEPCDGGSLGGATCASLGWDGGDLECAADCAFDTSGCHQCGDGAVDPGEDCDGDDLGGATCVGLGFDEGDLACTPGCAFDTSGCTAFDPSGAYSVSPAPGYQCAWFWVMYLVDFDVRRLTFLDDGVTLAVDLSPSGIGCVLSGPSASASRHIDLTCTIPGGCPETYTLVGDFTTDDSWSGTFTAAFGPGGCSDCVNRSWAVAGARL